MRGENGLMDELRKLLKEGKLSFKQYFIVAFEVFKDMLKNDNKEMIILFALYLLTALFTISKNPLLNMLSGIVSIVAVTRIWLFYKKVIFKIEERQYDSNGNFIKVFVLLAFAVGFIYVDNTTKNLPSITTEMLKSDASSNIYANDGQTLIYSTAENKRKLVKLADVPKKYRDLLLMTEDAEFYEHRGISPKGTLNAVLSKVKSIIGKNEQVRGGSSITQQLVKLTVFSTDEKDRTLSRKVKEAFLAEKLYDTYSRDEILEFYINKLYLGEGSYGAQTIANSYFGKDLNQLSISQLAIIAGLGQSPSEYNLYDNPEAVEKRRNIVLYEAYRRGKLTSEEYTTAKNTPVQDGLMERRWQGIQTDTQTT